MKSTVFVLASSLVAAQDFEPTKITAPFLEQFTSGWQSRWIPSEAKKIVDGVEDDDLLRFRGEWAVEPSVPAVLVGDDGLVVKTAAAHHAISAKFPKPLDPKGKSLVVQYEVKLQNGLECGGAYLKLLTYNKDFVPSKFDDKTPYTVMFGPDKCGNNNKVHFIFRHKNPVSGKIEEKHAISPPAAVIDKKTNLYTLVVKPDQTFEILVNNESLKTGSLLENVEPPVNPPKEIDDPKDKKPADWVDEAKIPDPKATKPADWDEDAPSQIPDESAVKPKDWLEDEPKTIPDPEAEQPEDWDDEEDGDWSAPVVDNPKCAQVSGCGPWSKPLIANPAYKGKWSAPLIDNPEYKGVWAPRKIANPDYFEDKTPADFTPIGAIGFELWTMQNNILFDNIYVGHSVEDAKALAEESWAVKLKSEKAADPEPPVDSKGPTAVEKAQELARIIFEQSREFINRLPVDPVAAVKELPHIASLLSLLAILPVLIFTSLGGKSKAAEPKTPTAKKEEKKADETVIEKKEEDKKSKRKVVKKEEDDDE